MLTQKIIEKEFALSGSEQNPDITSKSIRAVLKARVAKGAPGAGRSVQAQGSGLRRRDRPARARRRHERAHEATAPLLRAGRAGGARPRPRDRQSRPLGRADHGRPRRGAYLADKITRVAAPHRLLDPKAGPLIAVRLNLLTRKTLGGLQTDLESRVLGADGNPIPGLYAAGEAAGFGGGGMHGYRALEGTFLGGCIFSGRAAGRSAAEA